LEQDWKKIPEISDIVKTQSGKRLTHGEKGPKNAKRLPNSFDGFVKSRNFINFVIPAKAGIQLFQDVLDPGFRRGDGVFDFLRVHQFLMDS